MAYIYVEDLLFASPPLLLSRLFLLCSESFCSLNLRCVRLSISLIRLLQPMISRTFIRCMGLIVSSSLTWSVRIHETPETVREGYCGAYLSFFHSCGLIFPIPEPILEVLAELGLSLTQLLPNFLRHLVAVLVKAR